MYDETEILTRCDSTDVFNVFDNTVCPSYDLFFEKFEGDEELLWNYFSQLIELKRPLIEKLGIQMWYQSNLHKP